MDKRLEYEAIQFKNTKRYRFYYMRYHFQDTTKR